MAVFIAPFGFSGFFTRFFLIFILWTRVIKTYMPRILTLIRILPFLYPRTYPVFFNKRTFLVTGSTGNSAKRLAFAITCSFFSRNCSRSQCYFRTNFYFTGLPICCSSGCVFEFFHVTPRSCLRLVRISAVIVVNASINKADSFTDILFFVCFPNQAWFSRYSYVFSTLIIFAQSVGPINAIFSSFSTFYGTQ